MIDLGLYRWFKIDPVDAWFFRDGRPSNQGEDQSDLESEFPPPPPTVVGACRAALARENGWSGSMSWASDPELKAVLGDGFDDLGQLSFLGPFLSKKCGEGKSRQDELLWPLPQHVIGNTHFGKFEPQAFLAPSQEVVASDLSDAGVSLPQLPGGESGVDLDFNHQHRQPPTHPANVYVTTSGMDAIIRGVLPTSEQCFSSSELFVRESRIGISRNPKTRTTDANAMYSPRYVRLRPDVSLVEGIAGIPAGWTLPTLMPLGGESRLAAVESLSAAPRVPASSDSAQQVVINLAPASFANPWWGAGPGDDASQLTSRLGGSVITAAFERPLRIGGWNFETQSSRPLAPYVPPGSVWWLSKGGSESSGSLVQLGDLSAYGFGLAVIGGLADNNHTKPEQRKGQI